MDVQSVGFRSEPSGFSTSAHLLPCRERPTLIRCGYRWVLASFHSLRIHNACGLPNNPPVCHPPVVRREPKDMHPMHILSLFPCCATPVTYPPLFTHHQICHPPPTHLIFGAKLWFSLCRWDCFSPLEKKKKNPENWKNTPLSQLDTFSFRCLREDYCVGLAHDRTSSSLNLMLVDQPDQHNNVSVSNALLLWMRGQFCKKIH